MGFVLVSFNFCTNCRAATVLELNVLSNGQAGCKNVRPCHP